MKDLDKIRSEMREEVTRAFPSVKGLSVNLCFTDPTQHTVPVPIRVIVQGGGYTGESIVTLEDLCNNHISLAKAIIERIKDEGGFPSSNKEAIHGSTNPK